jgi:RimJ/RimL family protein N-acetyltransferase
MNDLLLRPWQLSDAAALAAIANNPLIFQRVRDAFPSPYTHTDAIQWISTAAKKKPPESFAVEYKGELVGSIGFVPGTDVFRRSCELGYFIGEPYWGKGIATEAVKLLTAYIWSLDQFVRIHAHVFSNNIASAQVLAKNGFELEATHRKAAYKNNELLDDQVWVKLRDELNEQL